MARINGAELSLEVDTGATLSIRSMGTYERLWHKADAPTLGPSTARLKKYTGETIKVVGELKVNVSISKQQRQMNLIVVEGNGPSLLGRDCLGKIRLDWSQINQTRHSNEFDSILKRYAFV